MVNAAASTRWNSARKYKGVDLSGTAGNDDPGSKMSRQTLRFKVSFLFKVKYNLLIPLIPFTQADTVIVTTMARVAIGRPTDPPWSMSQNKAGPRNCVTHSPSQSIDRIVGW